jgi:hypothetical protein
VRRFRPIRSPLPLRLALIPLVREVFWTPMALAMMGGLIAATILTLTFSRLRRRGKRLPDLLWRVTPNQMRRRFKRRHSDELD